MTDVPKHPAVFPPAIVELAREAIDVPELGWPIRVLDPFAGIGTVHALADPPNVVTRGIELMPRWAAAHPDTDIGDATDLPFGEESFDAVFTSPCYGNRMADHHNAADVCSQCRGAGKVPTAASATLIVCPKCKGTKLSHRRSYRHYYGDGFFDDAPIGSNAGAMAWGDAYRDLHEKAWREVERVLRPGGRFVLNTKNHVRNGEVVRVSQWHARTVRALGFDELWRWDVNLDGYRYGTNHGARVLAEQVYVFERSAS